MECGICSKPLGDAETVSSGHSKFHSKCFKCFHCERQLGGQTFYNVDSHRVCKDCYAEKVAKKCAACSKSIIGQSTKLGDGRDFHPECFVCHKCEKPIETAFKAAPDGSFEHTPSCENTSASNTDECVDCKKRLVNVKYFTLPGGDKSCVDCYSEKHAEFCYVCKNAILEGQSHTVSNWRYHKDCFTCPKTGCGKYLAGRKMTLEGKEVVCINCNE